MNGSQSMDQVFINKLTEIVIANLTNENFSIEELSKEAGMSRSHIHRKLQSITHQSTSQFIREIRLQRAKEMLQQNLGTASEIAFRTGFGSPSYFNKCFHDYYGYPPGEVKKNEPLSSDAEHDRLEPEASESDKQLSHKERIIPIRKPIRIHFAIGSAILIIIIVLILNFDLFSLFHKNELTDIIDKDGRIPIAVMPFKNLTNDSTLNLSQVWIQNYLISFLSNYPDQLEVRQKTSLDILLQGQKISNYASITPSVARKISKKLDVKIFITGSIGKHGDSIRLNAQLTKSKTGVIFKSIEINGSANEEGLIQTSDSIRMLIRNFLLISVMKQDFLLEFHEINSTNSPIAFGYFINGSKAFYKGDEPTAGTLLGKAIKQDSNFVEAYILNIWNYFNQGLFVEAKELCSKLYEKTDHMTPLEEYRAKEMHALLFETPVERMEYIRLALTIDGQNPILFENLGEAYYDLEQYFNAISSYEKQLEIYKRWRIKPRWINAYYKPAVLYYQMGMYKEARKLYRKAEKDFPEMNPNRVLTRRQAYLALSEGRKKAANVYIEKFKTILQDVPEPESNIFFGIANIYERAGILDTAGVYYRKGLSLRTTAYWLFRFANLLINNDIDINEGLELIDEAIELNPNDYRYYHVKGWGLYKKDRYNEARQFLETADSLKPIYNHRIYLQLQEVNTAIASNQGK